jgi:cell division protein FtsB
VTLARQDPQRSYTGHDVHSPTSVTDGHATMSATELLSASSSPGRPPEAAESVWSLAAFWLVAFAGAALFAAVMIAPRWERKQHIAARVRAVATQCSALSDTNEHLHRVIDAFKHDPGFSAEMARSELGYVAPGEHRIAAPVPNGIRPKSPEPAPQPPDLWAPFVRLFAHDRLVRQTALVTAAVFLVVALAFFHPQPEPSSPDHSST